MDDAKLLEEAISGRKDSLRLLLEKYYKAATAVAFSACHRADWAREAAAMGLAAAGSSITATQEPQLFSRYLVETVRAQSTQFLQGKKVISDTPESARAKIEESLKKAGNIENIPTEKLNELVLLAFRSLPDQLRETLALFSHYNNSYSELERIVGISAQELEERVRKAKAALTDLLTTIQRQGEQVENLVAVALKNLRLEEALSARVGEILAEAQTKVSQRSPVKAGIAVICVLGALIFVLLVLLGLKAEPQVPCDGVVERVINSAQIRYFSASKWLPLATADRVVLGSSIRTESGKCALRLGEKIRVVLADNTFCDLRCFKELHKVELGAGEIFVQSPEEEVEVEAAECKMFGKRCEFDVKVEPDGAVEVLSVKGDVTFFNKAGSAKLGTGKGARAQPGAPPQELKESGIENKTAWALKFLR